VVAQRRFIAIAGNIGSGKTELTGFLARRYGLTPLYEPHQDNPYLRDFYRDMKRWALRSQLYFLARKHRLLREAQGGEAGAGLLQDRTIYEDAEIFARHLHRRRCIDRRDFATYWALYEELVATVRPPDLLIYLRCDLPTLRERIRIRGRVMERNLSASYLRALNLLYEEWVKGYRMSPVLVMRSDRLDYIEDLVDRADLFRRIESFL
jgi:deoxyadenosine/deoxycytidine kinase